MVAHKKTAAITKPTVAGNGGHKGNGNTKSKKGKKGKNKTATWSYGAPTASRHGSRFVEDPSANSF